MPIRSKGAPGVTDHGVLTGLGDDDHSQYIRVDGTRAFSGAVSFGNNRLDNISFINMPFAPSDPLFGMSTGDVYFNIEDTTIRRYNGAAWDVYSSSGTDHGGLIGLADDDHLQYIHVDGRRAFTGDIDFGSYALTNVGQLALPSSNSNPGSPNTGDVYWNTADQTIRRYNGATWDVHNVGITDHGAATGITDDDHLQYIHVDGRRAFSGNVSLGGHRLASIGAFEVPAAASNPGSPTSGDIYWNTTADVLRRYNGATWDDHAGGGGGVTDHGALTGLNDNDHPQYYSVIGDTLTGAMDAGSQRIHTIGAFEFPAAASDPVSPTTGDVYWNTTSHSLKRYNGATWNTLVDPAGSDDQIAAEVTFTPAGSIAATDVQAAIQELDVDVVADIAALATHLADAVDAHAASAISFSPTGTITATDVQAAIAEVSGDVTASDPTLAGDVTGLSSANTVTSIRGVTVDAAAPSTGDVLVKTAGDWGHVQISQDASLTSTGTLTVTGLQGNEVTATAPSGGDLLVYTGAAWDNPAMSGDGTMSSVGALSVTKLRGNTVSSVAPAAGDLFVWDGSSWANPAMSGDATMTSGGVLAVTRIRGNAVTAGVPTAGDMLVWDGASWTNPALSGDGTLSSAGALTVTKIQGRAVQDTAPVTGDIFIYNGSTWNHYTVKQDLSTDTLGNFTVEGLQGNPVAATAPSSGDLLVWSGSAWANPAMSGDATMTSGGVATVNAIRGDTVENIGTPSDGDGLVWSTGSGHYAIRRVQVAQKLVFTQSWYRGQSGAVDQTWYACESVGAADSNTNDFVTAYGTGALPTTTSTPFARGFLVPENGTVTKVVFTAVFQDSNTTLEVDCMLQRVRPEYEIDQTTINVNMAASPLTLSPDAFFTKGSLTLTTDSVIEGDILVPLISVDDVSLIGDGAHGHVTITIEVNRDF